MMSKLRQTGPRGRAERVKIDFNNKLRKAAGADIEEPEEDDLLG